MPVTPRKYAKICYQFVARNANELSVLQDEILEVKPRVWVGRRAAAAVAGVCDGGVTCMLCSRRC